MKTVKRMSCHSVGRFLSWLLWLACVSVWIDLGVDGLKVKFGVLLPETPVSPTNHPCTTLSLAKAEERLIAEDLAAINWIVDSSSSPKSSTRGWSNPTPAISVQFDYKDSECSDSFGPVRAMEMYMDMYYRDEDCQADKVLTSGSVKSLNTLVFYGPCCKYALSAVGRYATNVWKVPLITPGGLMHRFSGHDFTILTRFIAPYEKVAEFVIRLLANYDWWHLSFLFHDNLRQDSDKGVPMCTDIMQAVTSLITYDNRWAVFREIINENYYHEYDMDHFMDGIRNASRVVVLCASAHTVRKIMLKAAELHFDNGEYVFINIDLFSTKSQLAKPWYSANDTDENNEVARRAYESLMTITLRKPDSPEYLNFSRQVKKRARKEFGTDVFDDDEGVNSFVGAFHDAVILYALALNETLEAGIDATNGTEITRRMWNRTFEGITGKVSIDENGDRNADYSLLDLNPETGLFQVVGNYNGSTKQYEAVKGRQIHWGGGRTAPPPDVPECGFDGSKCPEDQPFPSYGIVIIVLGLLLLIVSISAVIVYRHYKLEAELAEVRWRVRWEDIMFGAQEKRKLERRDSRLSLARRDSGSMNSLMSGDTIACHLGAIGSKQIFTKTGSYKAALVAIKKINRSFTVTKPLLMQFKKMRDLANDHIVRFIGVCIDAPNQCILTEYCQKGSLQDVLENDQIKLDSMFKFSLIQDIVRGMSYLHGSEIKSHGNLKSSNCVVDSRFVLKLTDFGLQMLRAHDDLQAAEDAYIYYRGKLWTAPELLRLIDPPPDGTQKGDVYSFAVICQEVMYRNGPFWIENMDMSPHEIYKLVKNGQGLVPLRPTLINPTLGEAEVYGDGCSSEELVTTVKRCWAEDPGERPDFHALKTIIKRINKDGDCSGNLLDNLLSRMEQYAYNLEGLVEARTADYLEQKKKAEDLLYMMLPRSVAVQLMHGETVKAEKYESVSIYFSDICGFTSMSAESTPMQVVDFLNDLYTTFDSVIDMFDVYKVETIGDAYMVVSGLPVRNGTQHAREISRMAISLLNAVRSFKIRHRPHDQLKLRIGIHSGPVCAGIVGHKMPRYCLFGDTVNTASRMESNGEALKIHLSPCTKELLDDYQTFALELRGPVTMKGKGEITTWWLTGENNPEFPDLAPTTVSGESNNSETDM